MDAVWTPSTLLKKTSNKRRHQWKRADALEFLVANQDEYNLDGQGVKITEQNRVCEPDFLTLTPVRLLTTCLMV